MLCFIRYLGLLGARLIVWVKSESAIFLSGWKIFTIRKIEGGYPPLRKNFFFPASSEASYIFQKNCDFLKRFSGRVRFKASAV